MRVRRIIGEVARASLAVALTACSTSDGTPPDAAPLDNDASTGTGGASQASSAGGATGAGNASGQGGTSGGPGGGGSGGGVGGATQGTGGALTEGGTSGRDGGEGTTDSGAISSSGGATSSSGGAATSSGGAKGAGGVRGAGGAKGSGGTSGNGGAKGAGGAAIGNGGASGSGGATGSGGTLDAGGTSGAGGVTGAGGTTSTSCLSAPLLGALGTDRVLVGASMSDATAASAPFTLRYEYLSGGMADGAGPCARCDVGCTSSGKSCANTLPDGGPGGCGWWGCWQWDQDPPGAYARGFFSTDKSHGQIPMITWYEVLQSSGAKEGAPEVSATNNAAFMGRYLANYKFLLDQIGQSVVFVHLEPDFWGYAEQMNADPHATPAAVASASSECTGFENSIAGLGRCMIDMARRHAPNAKVGLHGSGWGTNIDVLLNTSKTLNVPGEASKLGAFLAECGPDADFVAVDASDRDADWYKTQARNTWWDATNATLPSFHQAFTWATALAVKTGKPIVWWQLPVGNVNLPDTTNAWRDNRVDYFFDHMDEVAAAHGVAIAFGAGDGAQTTPETDGGHLALRVKAYATAGGQKGCP